MGRSKGVRFWARSYSPSEESMSFGLFWQTLIGAHPAGAIWGPIHPMAVEASRTINILVRDS